MLSLITSDKKLITLLFIFSFSYLIAQDYYLYVASESDDSVSLLKFDGKKIIEKERIIVGVYPTEINN